MTADELLKLLHNRDPRFLELLCQISESSVLASVVDGWNANRSAWAADEAVRYFLSRRHYVGHEVVIRRLINNACERRTPRVLGAAMVFADQLVARQIISREVTDRSSGQVYTFARIQLKHDSEGIHRRLFSVATRQHLRRKVWTSVRSLADETRSDHRPQDYCEAVGMLLRQTPGDVTDEGHRLLEAWCLMKACFGNHVGLDFGSRSIHLMSFASVSDLHTKLDEIPYQSHWKTDEGKQILRRVNAEARSRFCREWAATNLMRFSLSG